MNRLHLAAVLAGGIFAVGLLESAGQVRPSTPQTDASQPISFEAASIKQNKSGGAGSFVGSQPGGRLNAQNASLRELILFAYKIPSFQLVAGPNWIDADRWDIVAKLESSTPPTPQGNSAEAMALRTLLTDRFNLVVRRETRQLPTYALVLARPDGKLGPQITLSAIDCDAVRSALARGSPAATSQAARPCGLRGRVGSIQSIGAPVSEFVLLLSDRVQRIVSDRTGLQGTWDFTLTYTPEASQIPQGVLAPGAPVPSFDPNGPSLFTALQEQLGLKLDSSRGPVEVLVIERADRPTVD